MEIGNNNFSSLSEMEAGDTGQIIGYHKGCSAYRKKLLSMGLTPDTYIKINRMAPMGDPVELQVKGYKLLLRRKEASVLKIKCDK